MLFVSGGSQGKLWRLDDREVFSRFQLSVASSPLPFAASTCGRGGFVLLTAISLHQNPADVDQRVGNHSQAHPAVEAVGTSIAAAIQSVPPLQHADPALTPGSPFLSFLEPAFLLKLFPDRTLGRAAGDRNPFHSHRQNLALVGRRIESSVPRRQVRNASQALAMNLDRRHQEIRIAGSLPVNTIGSDDLILGFLTLDPFSAGE